ncbi:DUF1868 domain-containing protein [Nitrospirillum bahiense]|uniref:DUF1868 domain-containing protein n=1 Tax=Nitrospirillum amazonense TaxID=28077 RepID=A0A560G7G5_9PROT|nr:DUF1868 domain-containing protein [Nitrospirillum amazonense]TWB29799.1 hypothetical protein FBZ88_103223 [Nitrospirillum amazonense]
MPTTDTNRRTLLGLMGATVLMSPHAQAQPGDGAAGRGVATSKRPHDVGRKFWPDGRVKPFPGNTIVCHLPQQGENAEAFGTLLDIYREAPAHAFSHKITLLPPSSYHMTVFGGANDAERKPGLWPATIPLDAPIEECDRLLGDRLRAFTLDCALPLRMMVDPAEPGANEGPLTMRLLPADAAEDRKLRRLRDRLSACLEIRAPDHDRYHFHITLAYQIDWLTVQEDQDYRSALRAWKTRLRQASPLILLGAPEYCVMTDMFAFNRQFFLA